MSAADIELQAAWLAALIVEQRLRVDVLRHQQAHAHPALTTAYADAVTRGELVVDGLIDRLTEVLLTEVTP